MADSDTSTIDSDTSSGSLAAVADSSTSTTVNGGTFVSCSNVAKSIGNDAFWCWETYEHDYSAIWTITTLAFAMNLGQFLLIYGAYLNSTVSLSSIYWPASLNPNESQSSISRFKFTQPKPIWYTEDNEFISSLFYILNVIIHSIYFFIKVYIVSIESTHYFWLIDEKYDSIDYNKFLDGRVILLMTILTLSTIFFWMNERIFNHIDEFEGVMSMIILPFAQILMLSDGLFSFTILCIYYPLLATLLYYVCVKIIVFLMIGLLFILFSLLIKTIWKFELCILCVTDCIKSIGCIKFQSDDNDGIYIRLLGPIGRFMIVTFGSCISISFIFIFEATIMYFILFFVNGPPNGVFYIDFNNPHDNVIYWLFAISIQIGVIGAMIGFCNSCFTNCGKTNNQQENDDRGTHIPVANDSDSDED